MPAESVIATIAIIVVFSIFAATLAWARWYSPRSSEPAKNGTPAE